MVDDTELRRRIYERLGTSGTVPSDGELAEWCGGRSGAAAALRRLHDAHAVVLDEHGAIRMALPFSAVPTDHEVRAGDRSWWANCAWDALAVPAATDVDATIEGRWLDDETPVDLAVVDGELSSFDGFVHFTIPARHWWDDIVET